MVKVCQFCSTLCVLIEEQQSRKQSSKSVLCGGLMSPSKLFSTWKWTHFPTSPSTFSERKKLLQGYILKRKREVLGRNNTSFHCCSFCYCDGSSRADNRALYPVRDGAAPFYHTHDEDDLIAFKNNIKLNSIWR